jgi:hypothetical protein
MTEERIPEATRYNQEVVSVKKSILDNLTKNGIAAM